MKNAIARPWRAGGCSCLVGMLLFLAASGVSGALRTWTGGAVNANWSNPTNWGGVAPLAGDDLWFPPVGNVTVNNDFPAGTTFNSLIFSGGGYTLNGNSVALDAGILATNGANNFVNNSIVLNSNQTFMLSIGSAGFNLLGTIDLNGKDLTLSVGPSTLAQIQSVIQGAGSIIKTNSGSALLYASNTFSGPVRVNQGGFSIYNANALGSTSGNTTVASNAILSVNNPITVAEPLVLSGSLNSSAAGQVLTGPITLADTNAAFTIASGASLTVNAIVSGPGGFTKNFPGILTLNSNNTYLGPTIITSGTVLINGNQPNSPMLLTIGTLGGTGTVGTITSSATSVNKLSPGDSPGVLTCSNVTLSANANFLVEINGTSPGAEYDQLNVNGSVALSNAVLSATLGFTPAIGDRFTIINNDGGDPVVSIFKGLAEGAYFPVSGTTFRITYLGDSGNDVVLLRTNAPPASITSVASLTNHTFQLQGLGLSNLVYIVQATSNLLTPNWLNISTSAANINGTFTFTDTNAPLYNARFYRVFSP